MGPDVEGQGTHFSGRHRGLVAYGAAHQGGVECDCGSCACLECARRGEGGEVASTPGDRTRLTTVTFSRTSYSMSSGPIPVPRCADSDSTPESGRGTHTIAPELIFRGSTESRMRVRATSQYAVSPLVRRDRCPPSSALGRLSHWPNEIWWPTHLERVS